MATPNGISVVPVADGSKNAMNDKALSAQDAVDSFDRLRKSRSTFRFANESEAEEWQQDGRVDDVRQTAFDASWFPER